MGFVSLLEDIHDRRTADQHTYRRWNRFVSFRNRNLHASSSSGLKAKQTRKRAIEDLTEYLRHESGTANVNEAVQLYGNPFDWPKRLIGQFWQEYRASNSSIAIDHNEWSSHLSLVETLYDAFVGIDRLGEDDPDLAQRLTTLEGRVGNVFRNHNAATCISLDAFQKAIGNATHVVNVATQIIGEINEFLGEAQHLDGFADDIFQLTGSLNQINEIRDELDGDLCRTVTYADKAQTLKVWWDWFLQLRAVARRSNRPAIEELSRLDLNVEQEKLVNLNYKGIYRVQGASGSGKTIVLLHRAARLAADNPDAKVQVVTLSESLAELLESIATQISGGHTLDNLVVSSVDNLFTSCLSVCGNPTKYKPLESVITRVKGRPYNIAWCEFFGGVNWSPRGVVESLNLGRTKAKKGRGKGKKRRVYLHDTIRRRGKFSVYGASKYLREEARYIQSAMEPHERRQYISMRRMGRAIPLSKDERKACIVMLHSWESWLEMKGWWDHETIALRLAQCMQHKARLDKVRECIRAEYILIDEAQDLSTVDLRIIKNLLVDPHSTNALFLAGDLNQKIHARHQHPSDAGLNFQGRSKILTKNYRNTREILRAAYKVAQACPPQEGEADGLMAPELSPYEGERPLVVKCGDHNHADFVLRIVNQQRQGRCIGVLSNDEFFLSKVGQRLKAENHDVQLLLRNGELDRAGSRHNQLVKSGVVLGRLEAAKGYEFDTVIVAGLSQGVVPWTSVPEGEYWREAAVLYSALTRARDELFMTYVGKPSMFLEPMNDEVDHANVESGDPVVSGRALLGQ